jgi:hypothetical protein
MKIGEYDLEDEQKEQVNLPHSMHTKPNLESKPSLGRESLIDYEAIYVVGFNENYCSDESPQCQKFYSSLNLTAAQKRKLRPPATLASCLGTQATKQGTKSLEAQREI